jgi:predicted membrane-bound spermidine synthase
MNFSAQLLSFLVGFLSLGVETLWARTFTFANQSTPTSLAVVLTVYLLGIACGANRGGSYCRTSNKLPEIAAISILLASAIVAFTPALVALLPRSQFVLVVLICAPAFLYSICFPICHHLGTQLGTGNVGKSLSRVYAANILGSVTGPLIVNFGVLQYTTTQTAFTVLGLIGITLAAVLAWRCQVAIATRRATLAGGIVGLGMFGASTMALAADAAGGNWLISKLAAHRDPIRHIVETRQGIIVAHKDDVAGDIIFGGNVYDGRTNVDPRINSNGIDRIIVLSALAPRPKRVLIIGLSVGSWQHIIGGFPGVETMDVIEINPGYLDLARNYDVQHKAVNDPRVNLIIGDGRKYLRQNPTLQYDLVVMNTTWHWRMYVSLLLSREFLTLIKGHMTQDAVLAFNTTGSVDALKTATAVFPHAYLYSSFTVAGFSDWRKKLAGADAAVNLRAIHPAGTSLFGANDGDLIKAFLHPDKTTDLAAGEAKAGRAAEVITDRNLITEYKYGLK